jgi:hypothetical protein
MRSGSLPSILREGGREFEFRIENLGYKIGRAEEAGDFVLAVGAAGARLRRVVNCWSLVLRNITLAKPGLFF